MFEPVESRQQAKCACCRLKGGRMPDYQVSRVPEEKKRGIWNEKQPKSCFGLRPLRKGLFCKGLSLFFISTISKFSSSIHNKKPALAGRFSIMTDYRPLRRAVSCAIINSSLVGITTATALLSAVVITPALPKRAFRLASWSMCRPRKPK